MVVFSLIIFVSFIFIANAQQLIHTLPNTVTNLISRSNYIIVCHEKTITFISKSLPFDSQEFEIDSCNFLEVGDGIGFVKSNQNQLQSFTHPDGNFTNLMQINDEINASVLTLSNNFFSACVDGKSFLWFINRETDEITNFEDFDFYNSSCTFTGIVDTHNGLKIFKYYGNKITVSKAEDRDDQVINFNHENTIEFNQTIKSIKVTYKNIIAVCLNDNSLMIIDLSNFNVGDPFLLGSTEDFVVAKNDATLILKKDNHTFDVYENDENINTWTFIKSFTVPHTVLLFDAESISSVNYVTKNNEIMKMSLI